MTPATAVPPKSVDRRRQTHPATNTTGIVSAGEAAASNAPKIAVARYDPGEPLDAAVQRAMVEHKPIEIEGDSDDSNSNPTAAVTVIAIATTVLVVMR